MKERRNIDAHAKQFCRGLIHYTLVTIDSVPDHWVHSSIPAYVIDGDEGVMN